MNRRFPRVDAEFVVVADPSGWKRSENVVGAREFEAGGIEPPNERAVLYRNDAVSLSTAIGARQMDSFGWKSVV